MVFASELSDSEYRKLIAEVNCERFPRQVRHRFHRDPAVEHDIRYHGEHDDIFDDSVVERMLNFSES